MKPLAKQASLNRLKSARGHMDAVIAMIEEDRYCIDVMKQLSAVQSALERANRVVLQNHLETCVSAAIREGRQEEIIEELMDALKYDRSVTGPAADPLNTKGQR